jgi:hypothetical protein
MTFEEQLLRKFVGQRADKQRVRGVLREPDALRALDQVSRPQREEARFLDQSGKTLLEMGLALPPTGDFSGPEQNTMMAPLLF